MQWSIGLLLVFTLVFGIVAAGVGYLLREDEQLMIQYIGLAVIVVAPGILMLFLKLSSLFRR
jgi:peptidoglycan/LPS O-acetylase OafA/YrhL